MPNWCESYITINCKDEKSAKHVHDSIESWAQKLSVESDFGKNWLGNLLVNAGVYHTKEDVLAPNNLNCRGRLEDLGLADNLVIIQTETAWVPMMKMWKEIVDKVFPEEVEEILYTATEYNNDVFWTNDPDYKGAWYYADERGYAPCATEEEAKKYLLEFSERFSEREIGKEELKNSSVEELIELVKKEADIPRGEMFLLQKYEFVPIESERMD